MRIQIIPNINSLGDFGRLPAANRLESNRNHREYQYFLQKLSNNMKNTYISNKKLAKTIETAICFYWSNKKHKEYQYFLPQCFLDFSIGVLNTLIRKTCVPIRKTNIFRLTCLRDILISRLSLRISLTILNILRDEWFHLKGQEHKILMLECLDELTLLHKMLHSIRKLRFFTVSYNFLQFPQGFLILLQNNIRKPSGNCKKRLKNCKNL